MKRVIFLLAVLILLFALPIGFAPSLNGDVYPSDADVNFTNVIGNGHNANNILVNISGLGETTLEKALNRNVTGPFRPNATGSNSIVYTTGNVGIGTNSPASMLDVNGAIKVGFSNTCDASTGGTLRYNSTIASIQYCNTTNWASVSSSAYQPAVPPAITLTDSNHVEVHNYINTDGICFNGDCRTGWNQIGVYLISGQGGGSVSIYGANMTPNYLARAYNSTNLVSSIVYDDGTNVGIGTYTPQTKLDVVGVLRLDNPTSQANYFATINSRYDSSHPFSLSVENNNGGTAREVYGVYSPGGGGSTNSIFSNGNVGIGTTAPAKLLDVQGTGAMISVSDNASGTGGLRYGTAGNQLYYDGFANTYLDYANVLSIRKLTGGTATAMTLDASGKVGIGMTPSTVLDVNGDITAHASGDGQAIRANGRSSDDFAWAPLAFTNNGGAYTGGMSYLPTSVNLYAGSGLANVMTWLPSGYVGVNQAGPGSALDVNGQASAQSLYEYGVGHPGIANYEALRTLESGNVHYIQSIAGGTGAVRPIYVDGQGASIVLGPSGGNVGVGNTNPQFTLSTANSGVIGSSVLHLSQAYMSGANPGWYGAEIYASDNGVSGDDLRIRGRTSNLGAYSDLFTIKNSGNVGIGTTGPNAKLEVSGSTTPGLFLTSTNYPTTYRTQLGTTAGASGILVLGNNGANEIRFGTTGAGGYGNIYVNNVADYTSAASGTLAMQFAANGNVGVGIVSPSAKLDVAGTALLGDTGTGTVSIYNQLGANEGGEIHMLSNSGIGYYLENFNGVLRGINSARSSGIWQFDQSGNLIANSFSGAGTGLTGTAASLSIGGDAGGTVGGASVAPAGGNNGLTFGYIPRVKADGVMEVGQYIDMHSTSNDGTDYANRFTSGAGTVSLNGNAILHAGNYNSYAPTLTGTGASGTWGIGVSGRSGYVNAPDGDRNAATKLPNWAAGIVRFDFVGASSTGTGGNYAGVMTYSPYDGNTASGGDASYQLAFGSTATNGGGIPQLNIRKGIDTTWNTWYTILHSGNFNNYAPTLTGTGASGSWNINAATATNVAWGGITSLPAFAANQNSGRVRMYEVGCAGSWGSSCDANTNGYVDYSDTAGTVTTAAQPSITSVGTLTSLTSSGGIYSTNGIYYLGASNYNALQGTDTWLRLNNAGSFSSGVYTPGFMRIDGGLASGATAGNGAGTFTATGSIYGGAFYYNSDARLKKNITPLTDSLVKITSLTPVSFNWINTTTLSNQTQIGLIAQDVEKQFPELVHTDNVTGMKSVEYGNMVAPLIEAVKEQQKEIVALQARVDQLEAEKKSK